MSDLSHGQAPPPPPATAAPAASGPLDPMVIQQIVSGLQEASATGATRLPSRDIPMNPTAHTIDPRAQSDHVPVDPARQHYIPMTTSLPAPAPTPTSVLERVLVEGQSAILAALLFFVFQLPAVKQWFLTQMPWWFDAQGGGATVWQGMLATTLLFGGCFYGLQQWVQ